ncbi:hypothetical protein CCACVL1_20586 [Corchorus capsularis]|uniref:Peptidase M16 n=1 Tax=Corchorus capsularis TaxID=210143 RepID=A0A1R3HAH1_COCAP|nr:hypothetical protein CCACVL1_20586 [Corchorus capsularis]
MGSLPAEKSSSFTKMQSFRSLELLNVSLNQEINQKPFGVDYGRLDNGLAYYVRRNPKPKNRAALALAVKVGSVLEEENERGVAHMIEHLAFSATKKYANHNIVKFLESIGAEFGPCNNAYTSFDETVYEMLVPIDKPELLSEAILVLAEFSSEIRLSKDDLEKERGAVMEEYRGGRNANGRIDDAHWALMMEGSKYAERLPIGLEKVIQTVSSETLKQFYQKWYHMQNMAVIAVGDFPETESVVELIKTHFGQKISTQDLLPIPHFPVPSHDEPRFSYFVEPEASGSSVIISYKMQPSQLKTVKDYRDMLVESMFGSALNQRFFKISKRNNPPYFSCSAATSDLVARVRLHGFSEREISVVRALLLSSIESAYLERDQMESTDLRDEYVQHFVDGKPVTGIEYRAQLHKTIVPHISASEVSKYAEKLLTSCSCVIKIVEPRASAKIKDLKEVVMKIDKLENERSITPWVDEDIPEEIVTSKPSGG